MQLKYSTIYGYRLDSPLYTQTKNHVGENEKERKNVHSFCYCFQSLLARVHLALAGVHALRGVYSFLSFHDFYGNFVASFFFAPPCYYFASSLICFTIVWYCFSWAMDHALCLPPLSMHSRHFFSSSFVWSGLLSLILFFFFCLNTNFVCCCFTFAVFNFHNNVFFVVVRAHSSLAFHCCLSFFPTFRSIRHIPCSDYTEINTNKKCVFAFSIVSISHFRCFAFMYL